MKTVSDFYKERFGTKVYKISLDAGCTCPNRDGTLSYNACIFCGQKGSGNFSVTQIHKAKQLIIKKMPKSVEQDDYKFIAYFQNFTNTYGNLNELKNLWYKTLEDPQIVGLAIATRPDCLSNECLQVLGEIAKKYFVQIELGLQTCNNRTVKFINRCYKNSVYKDAIKRIHKVDKSIHVVTHIIFGLPYRIKNYIKMETISQMLRTVKYAVRCKTDGIKITNLYVLKNTRLAVLYKEGLFFVLELNEYLCLLRLALKHIPKKIIIHRLTGDPPKSEVIEPLWCTNKKLVLNKIKYIL